MRKISLSIFVLAAASLSSACNHENDRAMTPANGTTAPENNSGYSPGSVNNGSQNGSTGSPPSGTMDDKPVNNAEPNSSGTGPMGPNTSESPTGNGSSK